MLRGNQTINLDGKGRFSMPTKYRIKLLEECDGQFVVTADRKKCLELYPLPEWEIVERKLMDLSEFNEDIDSFLTFKMGQCSECELDSHGKILLPETLRRFANMDKRIRLIGRLNKFQIWDEDNFQATITDWVENGKSDAVHKVVGSL